VVADKKSLALDTALASPIPIYQMRSTRHMAENKAAGKRNSSVLALQEEEFSH
jgi:hypothetical protein